MRLLLMLRLLLLLLLKCHLMLLQQHHVLLLLMLMLLLHLDGVLLDLQLFQQQLLLNGLLQTHLHLGHPLWQSLRQNSTCEPVLQMLPLRLHVRLCLRL